MIELESLPDAVVVVDREGRILRVNAHTESLLGYTRAELVGQPIEVLVPERFRRGHAEHRAGYAANPRVRFMTTSGTLSARHKSGRDVPVEIMLSPAEDGTVVAVVRDITRRRELERFRDEYVGYISHDLKNPLSVIALQARLVSRRLAELNLREERGAVEVIADSAAFIDRMVREMLEMCYLESDAVELNREETDLGDLLQVVLERTVSTSDRAHVQLEIRDAVTATIDGNRIERVVVNFIQNALKYGAVAKETPIRVRVEAHDGRAVVSVIDQGPGLPSEDAGFVFQKYRRARTSTHRDGLGLGLYISRMIVEAHGGNIGVDSKPGQGARFYFEVPLAAARTALAEPITRAIEPARDESALERLHGVHALLVDDEVNALAALATLLREEGLRVSSATSGEEALKLAASDPPAVVVLDVEMPGMTGLELLAKLRGAPNLPAVLMTGFLPHHAGIAEARKNAGAAYVGKPIDVDELLRVLGRTLAAS